jgi:8-oxo-dGTP pyrophosphatase MutT (NUDIX family)
MGLFYLGHVDPGESDLETALRESEEESGLTKTDLRIIADFKKTIKVSIFVFLIWKCRMDITFRSVWWKY